MSLSVVIVPSGGFPVTVSTNGFGLPCTVATNGYGTAITQTTNGRPIVGVTFGPDVTPPMITSPSAISWPENLAFSHDLTANETVTWTKTGGADAALFTLAAGTLTMTAKNFEAPADSDANNTYVVQVTATDTVALTTNKTITVTITDVGEVTTSGPIGLLFLMMGVR